MKLEHDQTAAPFEKQLQAVNAELQSCKDQLKNIIQPLLNSNPSAVELDVIQPQRERLNKRIAHSQTRHNELQAEIAKIKATTARDVESFIHYTKRIREKLDHIECTFAFRRQVVE